MDIGSGTGFPSGSLSNFAPHPFTFDGIECASMEGLLQSLKFKDPQMQAHVCTLVGKAAKFKGKKKKWWRDQTLYWKGVPIARSSDAYQTLIENAFNAIFLNSGFRRALAATGNATLTHSMGKNKINETVLTEREFCRNLHRLRNLL
ncbi:hypothetical protein PHYNN_149 [Pantoea phage Phynn]|nr:hypothetical protein PHYNN_149 [Pantoea phage Phynn]